jgi:hypothetical protein
MQICDAPLGAVRKMTKKSGNAETLKNEKNDVHK